MSSMNLPIEIYQILERKLGKEDALLVAKSIEASLGFIEQRSEDVALQRKLEVREELRIEMRNELATKEDLAKLQGYVDKRFEEVNTRFERMDKKLWAIIGLIIFMNQSSIEFILKVIGVLK